MKRNRLVQASGLMWVLLGCAASPEPAFHLASVRPSPVTPGTVVTAYGTFPGGAQLQLGEQMVMGTPVAGGLRFTVPDRQAAGMQRVRVTAFGVALQGALEVKPRLDGVSLDGQTLTLIGVGWDGMPVTATRIEAGGLTLTPAQTGPSLRVTLPRAAAYGLQNVWVVVNDVASDSVSLLRGAGQVRSSVIRPVPHAQAGLSQQALHPGEEQDRTVLMVWHNTTPTAWPRQGLLAAQHEAALGVTQLRYQDEQSAGAARTELQARAGIAQVDYDRLVRPVDAAESQPVPALGPLSASTLLTAPAEQWHLRLMGLPEAWAATRGRGVTVAVVDTGVVLTHPDLLANLLPGYDFVDNDATPEDQAGHGTHVAGLIAAHGRVLGSAPEARLVPVRVLKDSSGGGSLAVARGVLWAAGLLPELSNPHPADIINLSLGTIGSAPVIESAVQAALDAGVIVVAAAGNAGGPLASPASLPGVISVTALAGPKVTYQPSYASRGLGLQLAAFGGDMGLDQDQDGRPDGLYSTDRDAQGHPSYSLRAGTSMAAPLTAGIAALALSSGTPRALLRQTLTGTATDLDVPGYDVQTGHGLVSARTSAQPGSRTYLLATDASGSVIAWTLADASGNFTLGNLPPGEALHIFAASDEDGDGRVAEAGELRSEPQPLQLANSTPLQLPPLKLSVTDGASSLFLAGSLQP